MPYCHDPVRPDTCKLCERYVRDPAFAAVIDGVPLPRGKSRTLPAKASPRTAVVPGCVFRGEATGETRSCPTCKGHVEIKLIACAVHGQCTVARQVAGVPCCAGCPDRARSLVVPAPPPLALTPTRTRALVTVAVGEAGRALLVASRPHAERYARHVGADFVVLDWPGHPAWPMSSKFGIGRVLDHYERIAYVDADVLLRPGCLNLFDACAPDEFGFADELPFHRSMPQFKREKEHLDFRTRMGFRAVAHLPFMFNAGVMVVPRQYASLLLPPTRPIVPGHCAEQDHTNAQVLDAYLDGRCKVRMMDRRANWQNWTDAGFCAAPPDAVLHWSGAGHGRRNRAAEIAACAEAHPWP